MLLLVSFTFHSVDLNVVRDLEYLPVFVSDAARFLRQAELLGCFTVEQALPMSVQISYVLSEALHRFLEATHLNFLEAIAH